MADEPHKRKAGAAAKKQPKDFDLFEEDILDDGGGDIANAAKRRRHGDSSFVAFSFISSQTVNSDHSIRIGL